MDDGIKRQWTRPRVIDLQIITPEDQQTQVLDDIEANLKHRFDDLVRADVDPSVLGDLFIELTEAYNAHLNLQRLEDE